MTSVIRNANGSLKKSPHTKPNEPINAGGNCAYCTSKPSSAMPRKPPLQHAVEAPSFGLGYTPACPERDRDDHNDANRGEGEHAAIGSLLNECRAEGHCRSMWSSRNRKELFAVDQRMACRVAYFLHLGGQRFPKSPPCILNSKLSILALSSSKSVADPPLPPERVLMCKHKLWAKLFSAVS